MDWILFISKPGVTCRKTCHIILCLLFLVVYGGLQAQSTQVVYLSLSKAISIVNVNLMKDMNMNAVRMSHYPPDQHFFRCLRFARLVRAGRIDR